MNTQISPSVAIIDAKLKELEQAQKHNTLKGNLNFGVVVNNYIKNNHLPSFLKKRKTLIQILWIETFFIPLFLLFTGGDITEKIAAQPVKAIAGIIALTLIGGLFFVHFPLRSLIAQANEAQHEVKKMILEDIKNQIQELEKNQVYE
jgi:hypothetical protein